MMQNTDSSPTKPGRVRMDHKLPQVVEIIIVFASGLFVIAYAGMAFGNNPVASIGSIWAANLLMLAIVHVGLRLRGQSWDHFGFTLRFGTARSIIRGFLQSIVVFVAATTAFVMGAILMANIVGMPEGADMSKYEYLRGNLPMTAFALVSVYMVSALAEEMIYRGFLITRLMEMGSGGKVTGWLAVVVSGIVFGLIHSDWGLAGMVQASFMGIALGASYVVVQRNLWVMILAHGYMDTILVMQMYFANGF